METSTRHLFDYAGNLVSRTTTANAFPKKPLQRYPARPLKRRYVPQTAKAGTVFGIVDIGSERESRVPLVQEYKNRRWKLPGGGVRDSETETEALVRELEEEINLRVPKEGWRTMRQWYCGGHLVRVYTIWLPSIRRENIRPGRGFEIEYADVFDRQQVQRLKQDQLIVPTHYLHLSYYWRFQCG